MSDVNKKFAEEVIAKIDAKLERLQKLKQQAWHLLQIEPQASWHPDWFTDLNKIKAEVEK